MSQLKRNPSQKDIDDMFEQEEKTRQKKAEKNKKEIDRIQSKINNFELAIAFCIVKIRKLGGVPLSREAKLQERIKALEVAQYLRVRA